jgi:hypothetical protein
VTAVNAALIWGALLEQCSKEIDAPHFRKEYFPSRGSHSCCLQKVEEVYYFVFSLTYTFPLVESCHMWQHIHHLMVRGPLMSFAWRYHTGCTVRRNISLQPMWYQLWESVFGVKGFSGFVPEQSARSNPKWLKVSVFWYNIFECEYLGSAVPLWRQNPLLPWLVEGCRW